MPLIKDLALWVRRLDIAAGQLAEHIRTKRRGEARPMPVAHRDVKPENVSHTISVLRAKINASCTELDLADDHDALQVIEHIARRAVVGLRQYGPLKMATDKRDWRQEAREEAADGLFYMTCLALERDA